MYLDEKGEPTKDSLEGYRASGVPGSVAGLYALHGKLGKKPWKEIVEPAIKLARDGFVVDKRLAHSLMTNAKALVDIPSTAEIWTPGRVPRAEGTTVANPLL